MPAVATGDVHAHAEERALLQDAFIAIRHGQTLDASEVQLRPERHACARDAGRDGRRASGDFPGAAAESVRLAETLTFDLSGDLGYRYPGSDDEGATRRLAEICQAEFDRRFPADYPRREDAARRLEEELGVDRHAWLLGVLQPPLRGPAARA